MTGREKAIAWAEYVLPIWEKYYPEDTRPRKAIEAAKTNVASYATDAAAFAASASAARTANAAARAKNAAVAAYATTVTDAAAFAAYASASAADASYAVAAYAAEAAEAAAEVLFLESHGPLELVQKARLLKLEFPQNVRWIEHKPEEFWTVLLEMWCHGTTGEL